MWNYEKRLQYPVNISQPNPKMAQFIMSQYGGPDGEMGAAMRYLSQRYAMPYDIGKAVLTDIGISVSIWPFFRITAVSGTRTQKCSPFPDVTNFSPMPKGRDVSHISSL